MKVIHVSTADTWRGGEQQIVYLFDELAEEIDQWVLCVTESSIEFNCQLYSRNYQSYPKESSLSLKFSRKLAKMAKDLSADIIHAHDSHSHTFAVMAALFCGMKQPIVLHRRVDYPVSKNWFSRYKYNYPQIKRIICVSGEVKRVLDQSLRDPSKSMVVHSGVDFERFQEPDHDYLRKMLGRDKEDILIGNVAAVTQQKDYFTFANAAELICQKHQKVHFVVIGEGDQRAEIEEIVRNKGIKANFTFLGFRDDVPKLLPGLDILLFSSEKEGLGTTIIDALLAEVAIVTTNAGGITEIVRDRKEAMVADVKDSQALAACCLELIDNDNLRTSLIEAGRKRSREFDKRNMALATLQVYNEVVKG